MEKLSELSKPVQIFKHPSGRNFWSVSADSNAGQQDVEAFYSQEYVSALLASIDGMSQTINVANDATRIWKERALAAEAKLATPVRLPRPACTYADHSYPAYSRKQVDEIITSSGMRFAVEGDE